MTSRHSRFFEYRLISLCLPDLRQTACSCVIWGLTCCILLLLAQNVTHAQTPATTPELIIKRQSLILIEPSRYQMAFSLKPSPYTEVAAPIDGTVQLINVQPGNEVRQQTELLRFDATRENYLLTRAKAALKTAMLRSESPSQSNDKLLADSELEMAKAELQVAEYDLSKTILRAPIDGMVFRVLVGPGQFVKAGETLVTMGNTRKLSVEIPVDRNAVKAGDSIDILVEASKIPGRVETILPLNKEHEAIRDLVESAATALILIDNPTASYSAGQTVYSPIVPRHLIAEIPNASMANNPAGGRRVQVLREQVVTDIAIDVLGPVGPDNSFVTGAFANGDFLITSTSQPLVDGTMVRPAAQTPTPTPPANNFDNF